MSDMKNCPDWPGKDPLMIEYHDRYWGVPVHDDRIWSEFIFTDTFQAGLSWRTILHKCNNFRNVFDDFDLPVKHLFAFIQSGDMVNDHLVHCFRLR